jgi:hypothetical protein
VVERGDILLEERGILRGMGTEISFKAEKKGRGRSDLFSKHITWSNAMERKVNIQYFIYESMVAPFV